MLTRLFYSTVSWDAEVDSDALFSNHTVEEIRAVEHKTRSVLENIRESTTSTCQKHVICFCTS